MSKRELWNKEQTDSDQSGGWWDIKGREGEGSSQGTGINNP